MSYDFHKQFIDGAWVPSTGSGQIPVINPADGKAFEWVPDGTIEDVDLAVAAAKRALPGWRRTTIEKRVRLMRTMFEIFKTHAEEIVELEMKELGAPRFFAKDTHCDYQFARIENFIREAVELHEKGILEKNYENSLVIREPIGVAACITPWNYPLGQVVQKVIPALLMGNTVVLKASQHTPLTACILMGAFDEAGFPKGTVNLVSGRGSSLGERLSTHPDVNMISFTGSTKVGIGIAQKAMGSLKHVSLELGGKSPFVWIEGMKDYKPAVTKLLDSILLNSGQTCTALSRLIVPKSMKTEVEALLLEGVKAYPVGAPDDPTAKVGPVSSIAQYKKIRSYIELGLEEGATLLTGEVPPEKPDDGYYIKPAIFTNVTNDMHIAQEEIFGPVLCVITYETLEEAIEIANDTPYGLNAAVYGPKGLAIDVARHIDSGNVYVNDGPRDITAPFGGYKYSGIGREGGSAGLLEFTQEKAIFEHGIL